MRGKERREEVGRRGLREEFWGEKEKDREDAKRNGQGYARGKKRTCAKRKKEEGSARLTTHDACSMYNRLQL